MADEQYGNQSCDMYRDFRELLDRNDIDAVLIATGPNWHATTAMNAAKAGKDMYCEKPCTKNIAQSLILAETMRRTGRVFQAGTQRRNLPHFAFACELARTGKLGKLKKVYAHPAGMQALMSGWLPAEPEPEKEVVDWDMYLGPAAWRPFNAEAARRLQLRKGRRAWSAAACSNGARTASISANGPSDDCPPPVEYNPPKDGQLVARYENGVELIFREKDWIPLGSCPVRFEGETGWVEAGDSGKLVLSSPELLAGQNGRGNRRLPGDVPRPRLPRLREDAQPAEGERRRGLQRAHRLPRREHRAAPRTAQVKYDIEDERVHRRRTGQSPAIRSAARTVAAVRLSHASIGHRLVIRP